MIRVIVFKPKWYSKQAHNGPLFGYALETYVCEAGLWVLARFERRFPRSNVWYRVALTT
jgi:hypothetical protein